MYGWAIMFALVALVAPINVLGGASVYAGIVKKGLASLKPDKPKK